MQKEQLGVLIIGIGMMTCSALAMAEAPSSLEKYVKPAEITQLDWLLLRQQTLSFPGDLRWDEYGLIQSITLYALNGPRLIGMTFLVNKQRYIAVPDHVARKVFADAVVQASGILKHSIPEIDHNTNVYANFVIIGGDIIGEYKKGQVSVKK